MAARYLVTGASGFLGRYVVAELLNAGNEVISTSRKSSEELDRLGGKVEFVSFDLNALDADQDLFQYFGKPDKVIHLAWEGLPNYESSSHLLSVLPAQKRFLENLIKNGLTSLTVAGTCMEYGMQEGELSEDMPAQPANEYARAKNELRIYLEHLQSKYCFSLNWARLFYVYGAGQNSKSLHSQLVEAITSGAGEFDMSPGDQIRDFLPVGKMAKLIVAIGSQDKATGIVNCCSGRPVTVENVVNDIIKEYGVKLKLNKGKFGYSKLEPRNFWGSTKKLETIVRNGSN